MLGLELMSRSRLLHKHILLCNLPLSLSSQQTTNQKKKLYKGQLNMFVIWVLDRSCLCALKGNFAWRNAALLFGNHCSYYHGTWSGGSTKLFLFTLPVLQVSIIKCNSHFDAKANHIPKRIEHLMWQFHLFLDFFFVET